MLFKQLNFLLDKVGAFSLLIDFTFSNFKCFFDDQQFSMRRPYTDRELQPEEWRDNDVSTTAALFGGNASGKSSFLQAIRYLSNLVKKSTREAEHNPGFDRQYFQLNSRGKECATDFFIDFIGLDKKHYQYQLSINDNSVLFESLRIFTSQRSSLLYERELAENEVDYSYKYGVSFTGSRKPFEKMTRTDVTYISVLHDAGYPGTESAYRTLANRIHYYPSWAFNSEIRNLASQLDKDESKRDALAKIMSQSNLGIQSMDVENDTTRFMRMMKTPGEPAYEHFLGLVETMISETHPDISDDERTEMASQLMNGSSNEDKALVFSHHGIDNEVVFEEKQESRGTLSSLAFFSMALRVLSRPTICLVDELDISLHPKYARELIRLFNDPATNPFQSQIIFTSHDVTLMSNSVLDSGKVLDRDQIWFVQKDAKTGESEVFPITELSVRRDENYMRNYLNGIYGALPDPDFHDAFVDAIKIFAKHEE